MLKRELPRAHADLLFPSDPGSQIPAGVALKDYDAILWTGCNATIYEKEQRVLDQIELAKRGYEAGTPQFGSCWGLQMAAYAAGGDVKANPKGREMGLARRILLTPEGKKHPMMAGRADVFEGFISHVDEVTSLPRGSQWLATNDWTRVQAIAVKHKKGEFWGVQYHPEYDLHEMARLTVARESKLIPIGFYRDHDDLMAHVNRMEALHAEPTRKDLRWQLVIDDDVLDARVRTTEFRNFLEHLVLPGTAKK
jgi:GMP synthase (glutamine-hydrolysing)